MAEKIEISLTDFIGFVNKMGSAKLSHVRKIKDRPEYEHYMDFYKPIREAILKLHKNNEGKDVLDTLLSHLSDDKKKNNYPALINGYKKFLGRKKFEWVKPPKKDWKVGDVVITVNPELGLEEKKKDGSSNFYIVKLYFKEEPLKKAQASQILTLMEMQLRSKVNEPEIKFAILDIRRSRLHIKYDQELKELPLLLGEAQSFATMWRSM